MDDPRTRKFPEIWETYIKSNIYLGVTSERSNSLTANFLAAKKAFYRGVKYCAWSREYWLQVYYMLLLHITGSSEKHYYSTARRVLFYLLSRPYSDYDLAAC